MFKPGDLVKVEDAVKIDSEHSSISTYYGVLTNVDKENKKVLVAIFKGTKGVINLEYPFDKIALITDDSHDGMIEEIAGVLEHTMYILTTRIHEDLENIDSRYRAYLYLNNPEGYPDYKEDYEAHKDKLEDD